QGIAPRRACLELMQNWTYQESDLRRCRRCGETLYQDLPNQPFKYFSESGDISPLLLFLQQEKHS
ncbi:hypothetical protein, partial [Escherichia coli]